MARRSGPTIFGRSERGNTAIVFAVAFPALLLASGGAINFAYLSAEKANIQKVADAASTNAARELSFARPDPDKVVAVAESYAASMLTGIAGTKVAARVLENMSGVEVQISTASVLPMPLPILDSTYALQVAATARVSAGPPICVIALEPSADRAINLDKDARLSGPGCAVYSNSMASAGITAKMSAVLQAELICSAGGKSGAKANFLPEPMTDCPVVPDPLVSRQAPSDGACREFDLTISGGSRILEPGVYCQGLRITGGAQVVLKSGIYVIRDGPFVVQDGMLTGTNVGFYLKGDAATFRFDPKTTIDLTAPKDGPLAGFLIFEDRQAKELREHRIQSDNARNLLGTIYLSRGRLLVDAKKPVADQSAYTIIVARRLDLNEGPNLVLNTGYASTDIPVPKGVGPLGGKVSLAK